MVLEEKSRNHQSQYDSTVSHECLYKILMESNQLIVGILQSALKLWADQLTLPSQEPCPNVAKDYNKPKKRLGNSIGKPVKFVVP